MLISGLWIEFMSHFFGMLGEVWMFDQSGLGGWICPSPVNYQVNQ